ncbi:MAG: hypothetical protein WCP97_04480 [bacterium]
MAKKQQSTSDPSTQEFLEIREIKNGIILLNDGSYRLIIRTTNVNFSLKSEVEQNAMIFAYRNFLNALSFPIQILIRSRELDIDFYLNKLKGFLDKQDNELLRLQTEEYIEYIKRLVEVANILDKKFYVVIPFTSVEGATTKSILSVFQSKSKQQKIEFENARTQLLQRADLIISQLSGIGIKADQLSTREVAQLFYDIYNPSVAMGEKMEQNIDPYSSFYVTQGSKAEQEKDMDEEIKK